MVLQILRSRRIKNIKGDVFILKNAIYRKIWENVHKKPYDTEGTMDITKIKVPHYYFTTEPHDEKVKKYYGYYLKHKHLDKAITVQNVKNTCGYDCILRNGYIRFLIAYNEFVTYKEDNNITNNSLVPNRLRFVPIKYVKEKQ